MKERVKSVLKYKKPAFWITMAAIVVCVVVAVCFLTNPSKTYQIRVTIPAGSTADFCYSDEEISPKGDTLLLANGEGLGDTEVILVPVDVREENAYELTYMTPGMPVKMDVEKGAWYKIGLSMQNPTTEDKDFHVSVKDVEVRIASDEEGNMPEFDEIVLTAPEEPEENAVLKDLAYYLELSVPDMEFEDMSETKKTELLAEYGNLLDAYTLMARESTDGKTSYIAGHYNGDITGSPLYKMQCMSHTSDKHYQILYLEENQEVMDRIKDEQAITDEGYVIENSSITWPVGAEYIFLQPTAAGQEMYSAFARYLDPARGRRYIEDALSRGIAVNEVEEPLYLDENHLSRLEEILKSAKFTGVGNCGYGAKLTLALENGETVNVFKGTDDCGSLVFGSWGGYSVSGKADDEFWEMFGLSPDGHARLFLQEEYSEKPEEEQEETTEKPEKIWKIL